MYRAGNGGYGKRLEPKMNNSQRMDDMEENLKVIRSEKMEIGGPEQRTYKQHIQYRIFWNRDLYFEVEE